MINHDQNKNSIIVSVGSGDSDVTRGTTVHVSAVECIILLSFFVVWICSAVHFFFKWHKLRLIEPREHTLKQKPKNLDSVKIVKRSSDSVIYHNYPIAMERTMALREKRLARMQTMPAIKLDPTQRSPVRTVKQGLLLPTICDVTPSRSNPRLFLGDELIPPVVTPVVMLSKCVEDDKT